MRISDATDDTYESLISSGLVVVAFYLPYRFGSGGYQVRFYGDRPERKVPRSDDIRRALVSATWECNRQIKVVFVDAVQCRNTCDRLNVFDFATFWLLKGGERIAELNWMYEGGHKDSYRLARETFVGWLAENLSGRD